jgi:hypothetical protein
MNNQSIGLEKWQNVHKSIILDRFLCHIQWFDFIMGLSVDLLTNWNTNQALVICYEFQFKVFKFVSNHFNRIFDRRIFPLVHFYQVFSIASINRIIQLISLTLRKLNSSFLMDGISSLGVLQVNLRLEIKV